MVTQENSAPARTPGPIYSLKMGISQRFPSEKKIGQSTEKHPAAHLGRWVSSYCRL